jgi:hypothetical protein
MHSLSKAIDAIYAGGIVPSGRTRECGAKGVAGESGRFLNWVARADFTVKNKSRFL